MGDSSKMYRELEKLPGFKPTGDNKWEARCPAHDDHNPSLSIKKESDRWLLYCQAGCPTEGIVSKIGYEMKDLFFDSDSVDGSFSGHSNNHSSNNRSSNRSVNNHSSRPSMNSHNNDSNNDSSSSKTYYDYKDESGAILSQVIRTQGPDGKKKFIQQRPEPGGGWISNVKGCRTIPYRLPELFKADQKVIVFIVEGEKDVDRLRSIGLIATCNSGGAGKWKHEHSVLLEDRDVVILPDNDKAGESHVIKILETLTPRAESIKVIRLPGLPEKGDVSDWLDLDNTKEDLLKLVEETEKEGTEEEQIKPEPRLQFRPFPVHCFPKKLAEFIIAEAKAVNVDPSMVAMPLLAAIAAAIGNARSIVIKQGWIEPAILWCGIVAASGDG